MRIFRACLMMCAAAVATTAAPVLRVSLVSDGAPGPASRHGLKKLRFALEQMGLTCEETAIMDRSRGNLVVVAREDHAMGAERIVIRSGPKALNATSGDNRGLMYGLLDVADRVGWAPDSKDPFSEVREVDEKPAVRERALSMYTMSRSHFESYFFNEDYWARYFDTLARNRFNTFALLFAYESSGYFAPAYPYFYDVAGFPGVRVAGDVYAPGPRMGLPSAALNGHWRDELAALKRGIEELEKQRAGLGQSRRSTPPATAASDREPPRVHHRTETSAPVGRPLRLTAEIDDPSGVKWVRLRYRAVNQHLDYRTLQMLPAAQGNEYRVEIPVEHIEPTYDFMYFIEAMDKEGNGGIYPDLEKETPYVVVRLAR